MSSSQRSVSVSLRSSAATCGRVRRRKARLRDRLDGLIRQVSVSVSATCDGERSTSLLFVIDDGEAGLVLADRNPRRPARHGHSRTAGCRSREARSRGRPPASPAGRSERSAAAACRPLKAPRSPTSTVGSPPICERDGCFEATRWTDGRASPIASACTSLTGSLELQSVLDPPKHLAYSDCRAGVPELPAAG